MIGPLAKAGDEKLSSRAYELLKKKIIGCELKPGQRLVERDLVEDLGISRTPIREALTKLEREGLIKTVPRKGCYVKEFSLEEMDELYEVRLALEAIAVRLAVRNAAQAELAQIGKLWENVPKEMGPGDVDLALAADEQFHEMLAAASRNMTLLQFLRSLNEKIRMIRRIDFSRPKRLLFTHDEHTAILKAAVMGDADEAERRMKAHITESRDFIRSLAGEGLASIYLK